MKKTKLLTSLAAFVLVLGLGACNQPKEEETTGDESGEVSTDTDTGSGEEGGSTTDTDTTPKETNPDGYVLVGDFTDSNWDSKVSEDSKYYIPLGTTEYKQTVTIAAEPDYGTYDPWDAGLRVVEWGDSWNLVVGSDELDDASSGVTGSDGSKNIKVKWGETYDITITFGETNSILVTLQEEGGNEGETTPTLFGFEYNGLNYYADGKTTSRGDFAGSVTANIDEAVPVTCSEAEGDNAYYLTFELEGTTYYICIITLNEYEDLQYLTTPTPIYWNETYGAWVNAASTYFLAYNATSGYECLWASKIDTYISSSPIVGLLDCPTIEAIELSAATQSIYIGRSVTINVTYTPSTIGASNLEWVSSSEEVATVNGGVVTGVAEGEVTITATTLNGKSDSIEITVTEVPAGLNEVKLGTYDFSSKDETFSKANGSTNVMSTTQLKDTLDAYWTSEGEYDNPLDSVNSTNYIYQYYTSGGLHQNEYNFLKTGTGSYNGTMELSLSDTITKAEIDQQSWSTSENCTVTVNNISKESASSGVQETLTFDIDETTNLSMTFAKRCYIFSITLYGYAA